MPRPERNSSTYFHNKKQLNMNLDLNGRNALVGGSSKGIGRAAAEAIARLGANVTLVSRSPEIMSDVVRTLDRTRGQDHDFLVLDYSKPDELRKKVGNLVRVKPIHILINNTGGPPGGPIAAADTDEFLRAFQQHLICNQILAQAVLPGMKAAAYGRIINVISTSVKEPIPGLGVSNTTRGAVASWAKTWAGEVAGLGITVNNVLPGFTATGRLEEIIEARAEKAGVSKDEMTEQFRSVVPTGRFADPAEVGNVIAFLASPAAAYVNGTNVNVDGGRTKSL